MESKTIAKGFETATNTKGEVEYNRELEVFRIIFEREAEENEEEPKSSIIKDGKLYTFFALSKLSAVGLYNILKQIFREIGRQKGVLPIIELSTQKQSDFIKELEAKRDEFNRNSSEYIDIDNQIDIINKFVSKCEVK